MSIDILNYRVLSGPEGYEHSLELHYLSQLIGLVLIVQVVEGRVLLHEVLDY